MFLLSSGLKLDSIDEHPRKFIAEMNISLVSSQYFLKSGCGTAFRSSLKTNFSSFKGNINYGSFVWGKEKEIYKKFLSRNEFFLV